MNEIFQKQGMFSWNELLTSDTDSAMTFYSNLLGWKYKTQQTPNGDYHIISVDDKDIGGIMAQPEAAKSYPPMWGAYVTVDDVDSLVAKTGDLGGKIIVPPTDIPDVGRFMVILDNQGAALTLISYLDCIKQQ